MWIIARGHDRPPRIGQRGARPRTLSQDPPDRHFSPPRGPRRDLVPCGSTTSAIPDDGAPGPVVVVVAGRCLSAPPAEPTELLLAATGAAPARSFGASSRNAQRIRRDGRRAAIPSMEGRSGEHESAPVGAPARGVRCLSVRDCWSPSLILRCPTRARPRSTCLRRASRGDGECD
jgi:hypothetical protein